MIASYHPLYFHIYPRKDIFKDPEYAWNLLESEVKLETSDNITGEDVSQLLQLYMVRHFISSERS